MSAIITLTTDFGTSGPFVGVMKAVILGHARDAMVIDLTHGTHPGRIAEAGFWLSRAWRYFPAGTVHVAVVDPGVGTARRILAATCDDHVFLAPDNGLLTMIPALRDRGRWYALAESWRAAQNWPEPSRTFHGRDIFAPLAAALASGRVRPADIGPAVTDPAPPAMTDPSVSGGAVHGRIVSIDTWGNLISNIDARLLSDTDALMAEMCGHRAPFVGAYGEAAPGGLIALINSFGVLEIACNQGSAAAVTGVQHGEAVTVIPRQGLPEQL